ncbi:MAG: hypothetical protein KAH54_06640 [Candidatus Sabulitectum sp.]|nr:hypothetical protein [Candidatus Sabulitectum sp.]
MYISLPRNWGDVISPRGGICVSEGYSVDHVREALGKGEDTFLIGADAVSNSTCWLLVRDHLALFGTGSLAGDNHSAGPRFPNLRGMYIVPDIRWGSGPVKTGTVLRVPDVGLSTGAELNAFPCDALVTLGIDQAIAAAHGGGRVLFVLNCIEPGCAGCNNDFSFLEKLIQEFEGGEE